MMNRREFMTMAAALGAAFGVTNLPEPVAAALKQIDPQTIPKLLYLQGQSCSGCSISLLQAQSPSPLTLITKYSQLAFHADLSATSGSQAMNLIERYIAGDAGPYILVLEGAIPEKMPSACVIGDKSLASLLESAAQTMAAAVAIGACACDGGIPGAEGNLTGAIGLPEFFSQRKINKSVIQIRGCSVHPDWVWQTVVHLVKIGMPKLNEIGSPKLFFSRTIHETCPRYHDFQQEIFAAKLGDSGCLFQLGCLGPQTKADCSSRWWNGGQTWCINAGAPCIGCASPLFARQKNMPFYRMKKRKA
ncbi:MAG: hydrogenase small subunit [Desulfobulbaceae bacterium]|nr:hydrogenase small subunit [Desulfobulbaceae bacterium]